MNVCLSVCVCVSACMHITYIHPLHHEDNEEVAVYTRSSSIHKNDNTSGRPRRSASTTAATLPGGRATDQSAANFTALLHEEDEKFPEKTYGQHGVFSPAG